MSGPAILALGPFVFTALGFSFVSRDRRQETPWSTVEVAGDWTQLQWVGPGGRQETIEGVLFPAEFGGLQTLEALKLVATRGVPLPLVSASEVGAQNIFGLWVIEQVSDKHEYIDRFGTPHKDAYNLDIRGLPAGASTSLLSSLVSLF